MAPITDDLVQFPKIFLSTATTNNYACKKHKDLLNYSLPICRRGLFLQDAFFEYAYDLFDKAVRRILERWGEMDFVTDLRGDAKFRRSNILSRYRQLRPHNLKEEDQAVTVASDNNSNKIVMDVHDLVNDVLKVKVVGEREVVVEGRLEHNKRDFAVSSNTFRRRFCLPQDTNMEAISSVMSSDGVLTITAPKRSKHKLHGQEMIIPIKVDGVPEVGVPRPLESPLTPTVSPLNTLGICRVCALNTRDGAGRRVAGTRQARDTLESFIKFKMQQKEEEKLGMMTLKPQILLIPKLGTFFSDSFFKDSWQEFQEAVKEVVSRWGDLTSTTDPLTCYRRLRATDLRQENQAVKSSEDEHNYKFIVDVQDFMDEGEISAQFKNPRELVVTGHVEHKASNSKAAQNFLHRFVLPGEVDIDAASSVMSADGVLTVTAPKKRAPLLVGEIVLPVSLDEVEAPEAVTWFDSVPRNKESKPKETSPALWLHVEQSRLMSSTQRSIMVPEQRLMSQTPRSIIELEQRVTSTTPTSDMGSEQRLTSPTQRLDMEPEPRVMSPIPRPDREPEPRVTSPTPRTDREPEPRVTSPTPRPDKEPEPRVMSPTPRLDREPEPRVMSPTPRPDREPEPRVTSPTPKHAREPEPRVMSPTPRPDREPEPRVTSPTPRLAREPEPRVMSPTPRPDREPEPRVTSPTPSDDSCDSLGQLWTLCPNHRHGVVIEEM